MKPTHSRKLIALAALACALNLGLAGCGGGGSDDGDNVGGGGGTGGGGSGGSGGGGGGGSGGGSSGTVAAGVAGVWCGIAPTGRTTQIVVFSNGLVYGVYTNASGGCSNVATTGSPNVDGVSGAGGLRGNISSVNGSNVSGTSVQIGFAYGDTQTINFSGSFVSKSSMSLNLTGATPGTMTMAYQSRFDGTLPLSSVAGTYKINAGNSIPGGQTNEQYTFVINANGTVTMPQTSGCSASGTAQSRTDVAALDLDITFTGNCIMPSGTHATGYIGHNFVSRSYDHLDIVGSKVGAPLNAQGFFLSALK